MAKDKALEKTDAAPEVKSKATVKKATAKKAKTKKSASKKAEVDAEAADEAAPVKKTKATRAKRKKKSLVIVESPAKARTINKYLGTDYVVRASMGHIRDLPKGKFGVDIDNNFDPAYTVIRGKGKVISELKKLAKAADKVYLAPDLDREGEAIAWHLQEILDVPEDRIFRVVFNEITKKAILAAFEAPGRLDIGKVDAQQARRVLDRIMGYKLSPLLWKKIAKGLSAGRVQSVAVRLIVQREKEIRAFISEEYWRVTAFLGADSKPFTADLRRLGDRRIEKNLTEDQAMDLVRRIGGEELPLEDENDKKRVNLKGVNELELVEIEEKPKTRRPTPPFTTSQLQQKASTMLRFSAKKTMMIAQQLYEGIDVGEGEGSVGLITYMRTDSTRVSDTAIEGVRAVIEQDYGKDYLPEKPNVFRTKSKNAQEAHEAIRPTEAYRTPAKLEKSLTKDQFRLYQLIWRKMVSSQMQPARAKVTTAIFEFPERNATERDPERVGRFVAQGEVMVFDGYLRAFSTESATASAKDDQTLPSGLVEGLLKVPDRILGSQHFTQPPPRFTEATLVKELEKKGIGRPSTYATIISTIQDRGYVNLETRRFFATELGEIVTDRLVDHFGRIINTDFTAQMEGDLDSVENGDAVWTDVVARFHKLFAEDLAKAETDMRSLKSDPELTDIKCDKCQSPMAVLYNKRGKFLGCSKYPECKNTLPADGIRKENPVEETDYKCPKCESPMVIRDGKRGRFLACTAFPKCKSTASVDEEGKIVVPKKTGIDCDKCGKEMIIRSSRRGPFLACSGFPKCRNAKPLPDELREKPKETDETCEKCGEKMLLKRSRWGKEFLACSAYPACKNARNVEPKEEEDSEATAEK